MIPEGAKITIEYEYKVRLNRFRNKKYERPMTLALMWKGGAEYGCSLAQTELKEANERIKELEDGLRKVKENLSGWEDTNTMMGIAIKRLNKLLTKKQNPNKD